MSESKPLFRRIRSFVRREGRLTPSQQRALASLWPHYGIEADGTMLDLEQCFGGPAPVVLEIGFGNGESLVHMAAQEPQYHYLGIEVHRPGVGALLLRLEEQGLENVRLMSEDAVEILRQQIPDHSLSRVMLFFPDPWHKKKHHKRRIVQPDFVALIRKKLIPGGHFHMATDWQHYAEHMMAVMSEAEGFENVYGQGVYAPRPDYRPITKFERRGRRLGHGVWDMIFRTLGEEKQPETT